MFKSNFRKIGKIILIAFVAVFYGCAKDLVTGKKVYNWFSLNEEARIGDDVMRSQLAALKEKGKSVDAAVHEEMWERIKTITSKIAAVSHYPTFPFEAHYADLDIANAWCAPGGKVMVYRGIFDPEKGLLKASNDDEIAGVIAHEIAHATARHVTESLSRGYTAAAAGQIAVSAINASGPSNLQNIFNRIIVQGIDLYLPYYSRSNEVEADRIGIMYMAKAGYNPQAVVDLWYRACKKKGDSYSLYNSHPSNCQRAKDLEKLLPAALAEYEKRRAP